ncbi:MAG: CCA tRNA nucleotidyltransferase [Clostridia bacterium]|nr:CCA tRNA nucleotidyltransferase [Clostridia bacterium]
MERRADTVLEQSEELKKLSGYFPKDRRLYAVGGCVRDALRGKPCYDIDLAGTSTPEQLIELLKNSEFKVCEASPRLGTMIIKGKYAYEYTTFRTDSYPSGSGIHTPTSVQFTEDIQADARRRDFKCNAVYYDIADDKIVDPLGGIADIEKSVLSTVVEPDTTLGQDGLRIMRMARFVSTLGYSVEERTLDSAKRLVSGLKDITVERIREELDKLLAGDNCYDALRLMNEIGALKIILPEVALNDNIPQKIEFHKYDVLEHTFKVVENCPPHVRLAGLFHDVGKGVCYKESGNTYLHNLVGAKITEEVLTRLKYPKKAIERTSRLVHEHMFDVNGNAREVKYRRFIAKNLDILDDLIALFKADCIGTGYLQDSRTVEKIGEVYRKMLNEKVALSISQLDINGKDLAELGFAGKEIGEALDRLWDLSLRGSVKNDKQSLIAIAKRMKKNTDRKKDK